MGAASKKAPSPDGATLVATALIGLGADGAAEQLTRLPAEERRRVVAAMARLTRVTPAEIDAALVALGGALALHATGAAANGVGGGVASARRFLEATLGTAAASITAGLGGGESEALAALLAAADDTALHLAVARERPTTLAVVLAHLTPTRANILLKRLGAPERDAALMTLAKLAPVAPETLSDLREALATELARTGRRGPERGGARAVASIVAAMGRDGAERVLAEMSERAPATANAVREQLFRFEDLTRLSPQSLSVLMRAADGADLRLALRAADAGLRTQLLAAISPRAAAQLEDDVATAPKRRQDEIEAAQRRLASLAQKLAAEGRLELGDEDAA